MSDFTDDDVEAVADCLASETDVDFPTSLARAILASVAPAMRDRWRREWEAEHQCLRPYTETDTQSWPSGGDQ